MEEERTCPGGDAIGGRQGSVREDAGWVPQGADNDGEENIAVFFFFFSWDCESSFSLTHFGLVTKKTSAEYSQWKNLQSLRYMLKKKVLVHPFEFFPSLLMYLKIQASRLFT